VNCFLSLATARDELSENVAHAGVLREKSVRSASVGRLTMCFIGHCRQQKDSGSIVMSLNSSRGFKPVHPRHLDIHQDQVWLQTSDEFDSLKAIGSLSRDLKLGNPGQKRLQEFSKGYVLIGN